MKSPKSQSFCISLICMVSIICTCFLLTNPEYSSMVSDSSQPIVAQNGNIMPDVEIVQKVIEKVKDIISVSTL